MRALGLLVSLLMITGTAQSQSYTGTYAGHLNGTPTTVTLQQQGAAVEGRVDASGYPYELSATAQGTTARGTLADPQTGGGLNVELSLEGNALTLTLLVQDAFSGQVSRMPSTFRRSDSPVTPPPSPNRDREVAEPQGKRDPALVGMWTFTETLTSGTFSSVTQLSMRINPDGTYLYGNGRTMAGGSSAYGSISGDTGYGGDVTRGQWRTQGGIVYVKESGMGAWTPYAR